MARLIFIPIVCIVVFILWTNLRAFHGSPVAPYLRDIGTIGVSEILEREENNIAGIAETIYASEEDENNVRKYYYSMFSKNSWTYTESKQRGSGTIDIYCKPGLSGIVGVNAFDDPKKYDGAKLMWSDRKMLVQIIIRRTDSRSCSAKAVPGARSAAVPSASSM
jgi:hypothetical protein